MPRRDLVAHAKYTELPEAGLSWVKSLGCLLLGYVPHKQGASLDLPQRRCQAVVSRQVVEIRARRFRVLRSHLRDRRQEGFDAPICQDTRSGGVADVLTIAEVCHDALIDLASEKAFETPDDVPFGPAICPTSDDIVDCRLVIAHTDHDGSMEGGVRLSMAAPIEAVSAGGHPGRGGDGTRTTELGKGGF